MNRFVSRSVSLVCVVVSLLAFSGRAEAAVRVHVSRGTAQFVSPTAFVGAGHATHLGVYSETGSVSFSPTSNPAVLRVDGSAVYTAANGDELHAEITGELNGQTGALSATVRYVGGTGRFAGAVGDANLTGQAHPNGTISVVVIGSIDY